MAAIVLMPTTCERARSVDLLQYQFGYQPTYQTLMAAEKSRQKQAAYSRKSRWFRLRVRAFVVKQVLAVVAAVWLVLFIGVRVAQSMTSIAPAAGV